MKYFALGSFLFATLPVLTFGQHSIPGDLEQAFDNARYAIASSGSSLRATNAANRFSVEFSGAQTTINTGQGTETLVMLDEYGWGSALRSAGSVSKVTYSGRRLDRQYSSDMKEWFENSSQGLEQGFILAYRDRSAAGPLHIRLSTAGEWRAQESGDGLQLKRGSNTLQYTGLKAWDARGTLLTSRLRALANQIEIEVDDARAVYPLTVDPAFVQQATLTASDAAASTFGTSVSLSSDGNTAIVGAVGNNGQTGAAYVFMRSSTGAWTQQAEFTAFDGVAADEFGTAVALSGDGNTAMVGAKTINSLTVPVGVAYVFTRSGSTWTFQVELVSPNSAPNDLFGDSISLSNDGSTALIGASGANYNLGAAYVFTGSNSGTNWVPQATLATVGATTNDGFGATVSLSSDGNTALVGASNKGHGVADVYTRSAASWSLQQELTASDATTQYTFGSSVALSGDGNTAVVGSPPNPNISQIGAAYTFIRSGASWTQQQKLTDPSPSSFSTFGSAIVLSGDGNTALLGTWVIGFTKNVDNIADVYGRSGTTWTLHQQVTSPADPNDGYFYGAVALSADATTALVGLGYRNYGIGSAEALRFNATASAGPPTRCLRYSQFRLRSIPNLHRCLSRPERRGQSSFRSHSV